MAGTWRWLLGVSLIVACETSPSASEPVPVAPTAPSVAEAAPAEPMSLVDRARKVLDHDDVRERGDGSLSVVHRLDQSALGQSSAAVADAMMDAVFYTADALYEELAGELDGLAQSFAFNGNVVATIKFTRETFDAVNYEQRMVHLAELESAAWTAVATSQLSEEEAKLRTDEAERAAYAAMLDVLPRDAVRIDMRYRP